jgi:hypothetical protein
VPRLDRTHVEPLAQGLEPVRNPDLCTSVLLLLSLLSLLLLLMLSLLLLLLLLQR